MSLWIKICGNTSLADAQLAADAGADAVGFVFAPSPRRVTVEQVAAIAPKLPAQAEKIGVFVDCDFPEICDAVAQCGLTGVQLHSGFHLEFPTRLRQRFGPGLRILRVLHFGEDLAAQLVAVSSNSGVDAVLIDSRTATAVGGTGIAFDWQAAQRFLPSGEDGLRTVVAGGLTPDNVAGAIATLRPWGVDVVSGVEAARGVKDPAKIRAFVERARAAATNL